VNTLSLYAAVPPLFLFFSVRSGSAAAFFSVRCGFAAAIKKHANLTAGVDKKLIYFLKL
jgi:hypothetical protein